MQTHIIIDGVVANTIMATAEDAQSAYPVAVCIAATHGGIGWTWDGTELTPPDMGEVIDPVPEVITPRQAKIALLQAGLLDDVEAAIAAIPDETTRRIAQVEWEYAQEVRRYWPLLVQVAGQMGLTDEVVDELFRTGAGI